MITIASIGRSDQSKDITACRLVAISGLQINQFKEFNILSGLPRTKGDKGSRLWIDTPVSNAG